MALNIDPQKYRDASRKLSDLARDLATARTGLTNGLAGTGAMAGTTDSAVQWASGYDKRASSAADTASRIVHSTNHLSYLVALAGYNHALANYNADTNPNKGRAPEKPSDPSTAATVVNWVHPPAAGGHGTGLETSIPNLLESIGVPVPDGNTDKLKIAADAWHKYSNCDAIANAQIAISSAMALINDIDSPEIGDINRQLDVLRSSAGDLATATYNLEVDCHNHKYKLDEMRKSIRDAVHEVIVLIDESLALDILASFVTAGVGLIAGAALTANVLRKIKETGTAIKGFIMAGKFEKEGAEVLKAENAVERTSAKLAEVDALEARTIEEEAAAAKLSPTPVPPEVIAARQDAAREFYVKQGFDPMTIDSHLSGIDFTKPVEVTTIPKGTEVVQYQVPGAPMGKYYAPPGTPASELGINPQAVDRATGNIIDKTPTTYVTNQDVQVLRSTAAQVDDTWSVPGKPFNAGGGGTQFMTTSKDAFVPK